jgi:hypothetical protein
MQTLSTFDRIEISKDCISCFCIYRIERNNIPLSHPFCLQPPTPHNDIKATNFKISGSITLPADVQVQKSVQSTSDKFSQNKFKLETGEKAYERKQNQKEE